MYWRQQVTAINVHSDKTTILKIICLLDYECLNWFTHHFCHITTPQRTVTPYYPPHQTQTPGSGPPLFYQVTQQNLFPYIYLSSDQIRGIISLFLLLHSPTCDYLHRLSLFLFPHLCCCHFLVSSPSWIFILVQIFIWCLLCVGPMLSAYLKKSRMRAPHHQIRATNP